jgi:hypothetical protein
MKFRSSLLLVCAMCGTAMTAENPKTVTAPVIVSGVTLPVVLKHKLDAAKVKQGDIVKMELVETIAGSGASTIPSGAKVYGQVVGATKLAQAQESRLALSIDRIEWKHVVVPIRAVVTGFGALHVVIHDGQDRTCRDYQNRNTVSVIVPATAGTTPRPAPASATMLSAAMKGCVAQDDLQSRSALSKTQDIVVRRLKVRPDVSVLISAKKDVVLKGGTLLLIRNLEEGQAASLEKVKP